jgi:hypothetical protein
VINFLKRIKSKILLKITILVVLEIIPIIGSFGVLTYFQSPGSSLGNSINSAAKYRYSLPISYYKLNGSSEVSKLKVAMNNLQSNTLANCFSNIQYVIGKYLKPCSSSFHHGKS